MAGRSRKGRKADKRLEARRADWARLKEQAGTKRPGSRKK